VLIAAIARRGITAAARSERHEQAKGERDENDSRSHSRYGTAVGHHAQPEHAAVLEHRGLRSTRQRRAVLSALAAEPNDATAQQIHARLRDRGEGVGLATVYRTLALLSREGVVDALMHQPGEACYRLCGEAHHHHLVCGSCHRVIELGDCELDPWLDRLAAEHGFIVDSHTVEVSGTCAACRASA
jgi:Fur family ferric uptake transcriptional regulator